MIPPLVEPCPLPVLQPHTLNQPYTVLLHSASGHPRGTWSLLAQHPWQVAIVRGTQLELWTAAGCTLLQGDPWALLGDLCRPWHQPPDSRHPCPGGVFGFLGYEFAHTTTSPQRTIGLPDAVVGWYREVLAWQVDADHAWRGVACEAPQSVVAPPCPLKPTHQPQHTTSLDQSAYIERVEHLLEYIRAGDMYQANLTLQLHTPATIAPWDAYTQLYAATAAPFSAWITLPQATILSASPEQFLWCSATGTVETCPIKGTRPRGTTACADQQYAEELFHSPKERAENLMITDLLRNDLGKVCTIGSVQVPELWRIERLATVHHLVSTVQGQLRPDCDAWQLLQACWPGGSITGAPKKRAMEIIAELEPVQREIYCGTIGYWGFDGSLNTSIAIRTLVQHGDTYSCGVGCGIVADSDPQAEYAEALLKAQALLKALEPSRQQEL